MAFKVCCSCDLKDVVSVKSFHKSNGGLVWQHQLYQPQLATDGTIWGIVAERDNSAASMNYRVFAPSITWPATTATPEASVSGRFGVKLWYRQLNPDTGETLYDTTWNWYSWKSAGSSDAFVNSNRPFILAPMFQQDAASINEDGWHVTPDGGAVLCRIESFDTYNTTATRSYRLVAAPIRSGGSASMTFTAAANGIHAETTVTITNVVGMTAASFASQLAAGLPHIVSITATGGNYPYEHIDFEIEWETNSHHFKTYTFPSSSAVDPVIRDVTTGSIKGVLTTTTTLRAQKWQWLSETEIVGVSSTLQSFANVNPLLPPNTGHCVQKMTVSGGVLSSNWVSLPCEYRTTTVYPHGEKILYSRPSVKNGTLIVTHTPGRGDDQSVGETSTWHQLSTSDGSLTGNGVNTFRFPERFQFATETQLFAQGVRCIGAGTVGGVFNGTQRTNGIVDGHCELTSSLSGSTKTWEGSYGPTQADITLSGAPVCQSVADGSMLFWSYINKPSGTTPDDESAFRITPTTGSDGFKLAFVMSVASRSTFISPSNPAWSSVFSFADGYYVNDYRFESPVNCRWNTTDLEWRTVWMLSDGVTIAEATDWLAFDADETDWQTAVDAVWGVNYTDHQNCIIDLASEVVPGSEAPLPLMAWERFPTMTIWSQNPDPGTGQAPDYLADHTSAPRGQIQLRSTTEFGWVKHSTKIGAMNWSDGVTLWERSFGRQRKLFLSTMASSVYCVHTENQLVCAGMDVLAESSPETYTFTETQTWTCPDWVDAPILVRCWGAGGGGGATDDFSGSSAGGGGGGAFSQKYVTVTPGQTYTITVGSGGAGGNSGNINGQAGGDSWFSSVSEVLAKGGQGGTGALLDDDEAGGAGGAAASGVGTVKYSGGNGAAGVSTSYGGGGGASAGTSNNGAAATNGTGAIASNLGGNGGNGSTPTPGSTPGGGGGGNQGTAASNTIRPGAAGGGGLVTLTY